MNSFVGKPLNLLEEYCKKNKIKYIVSENSFSNDAGNNMKYFVVGILKREELIEIIVSKFKIEV